MKRQKLRNAPSLESKNIGKERACPFTEMGKTTIGADLGGEREKKLTFGLTIRLQVVY